MENLPHLRTGRPEIDRAFRIAVGDVTGNLAPWKDGLLEKEEEVLLAGLDYDSPWTRDSAINAWNGAGLLFPEAAENTLLSTLCRSGGTIRIGGQYWDAIIWAVGAWWQYLFTGDKEFLKTAQEAVRNSLRFFEQTEFDPEIGLFRGAACYGDGVSAYPDFYAETGGSGILDWAAQNRQPGGKPGAGIPICALSTNCLYYATYRILTRMSVELGVPSDPLWEAKAEGLKSAINRNLWDGKAGRYDYFVDPRGRCRSQEGIGLSFALLFGVGGPGRAEQIFRNTHVCPAGIPCLWPSFARYDTPDGSGYGRHSGTVWPHIQGFWAQAAARRQREKIFLHEFDALSAHAVRDAQFAEIYHPVTGQIYGGRQEQSGQGIIEWKSCSRQTWSATAFLRMVFGGLAGMEFLPSGIRFAPLIPEGIGGLELTGIRYHHGSLRLRIEGTGQKIAEFRVNGESRPVPEISADEGREAEISIRMEKGEP